MSKVRLMTARHPPARLAALAALVIAATVAPALPAAAMDFSLQPIAKDTAMVVFSGRIERGDTDKLTALIKLVPRTTTVAGVLLETPGGALLEATRLARVVHDLGWKAAVPSGAECASSCILLFAAASARFAAADAEIGVHSAAQGGLDNEGAKAATVEMARAASGYGVPDQIIVRMVETPPNRIAWLSATELRQWGVKIAAKGVDVTTLLAPSAGGSNAIASGAQSGSKRAPQAQLPPASVAAVPPAAASGPGALPRTAATIAEPGDGRLLTGATLSEGGQAFAGSVTWSLSVPADGPQVVADADVPGRGMKLRLIIRQNTDKTVPASHMIEVRIATALGFPGGGVRAVPSVALRTPGSRPGGDALIAAAATVNATTYWLALSGTPRDLAANLALLDREVIDIRLTYADGSDAVLTLEKGPGGGQVFAAALAAWRR